MKHAAAYLLLVLGGNEAPTRDDVRAILETVGAEADDGKMELLFPSVEGRDVHELIAAGRERFAYAAPGGAAAAVNAAADPAVGGAAEKEEEKVEEKVEEEEDDNMFSLFDD